MLPVLGQVRDNGYYDTLVVGTDGHEHALQVTCGIKYVWIKKRDYPAQLCSGRRGIRGESPWLGQHQ